MTLWRCARSIQPAHARGRCFTTSARRFEIKDLAELPPRTYASVKETNNHDLPALQWPSPLRNILLVRKDDDVQANAAVLEYARHIHSTYPEVSLIFEPDAARRIHDKLPFPIYTPHNVPDGKAVPYQEKVDLTSTLGGDGTILHAASLFATAQSVPPILSFSMGTLGFLGGWNFTEYKRAFRQVYVSGAPSPLPSQQNTTPSVSEPLLQAWSNIKGKSLGATRQSRILLRNRLRIGIYSTTTTTTTGAKDTTTASDEIFALNEVLLHRGADPHLAHITILLGPPGQQRTLTTAIADGFLVSTPTGSTAYSLSSGGSIVHPLVPALCLTPICPRSLSFRPLVLPANTPVTLRIEKENRGKEIEVSVDGERRSVGLRAGMEVRVVGEEVGVKGEGGLSQGKGGEGGWRGGVPSIVRSGAVDEGQDHWVGGLKSLLKFNYPFGEDG